MLTKKNLLIMGLSAVWAIQVVAQNFDDAPRPYGALPSERQLALHETEMYCLIHFTPTTFQDKEWGYGDADPAIFNPQHFDAEQIVAAAKAGGFKGIITVAKHHDGFALWPTKTAAYNISESPWRDGKGDMVKEFQLAARKLGMKFGVYCSPWDRNNPAYGTPEYVQIYRNQLKELYSHYGELFMSWHDGANGGDGYYGGRKEQRKVDQSTYYDWPNTWAITRTMQPNATIFSDIGPDVRWVGNEKGSASETSWSTITFVGKDGKQPMPGFLDDSNLGTGTRHGERWVPTECDVPLRPGWFYHAAQDDQVKTPAMLFDPYCKSVGRGGLFDLGLSPDTNGLLHAQDVAVLRAFGDLLRQVFAKNLLTGATFKASNIRSKNDVRYGTGNLLDADRYSYWATNDDVHQAQLEIDLPTTTTFNIIRLRENIKLGQRLDSVQVDLWQDGRWQRIAHATSIGANRIIRMPTFVTASKLRLQLFAPVSIALSEVGLFVEPSLSSTSGVTAKRGLDKTKWKVMTNESQKHILAIDLGRPTSFSAFGYLPRLHHQTDQLITHYQFLISNDAKQWIVVADDEFANIKANPIPQYIRLEKTVEARYIKWIAKGTQENGGLEPQLAELEIYK